MRVHFIDTSVFTNILDIPFMNDQRKEVIKELNKLIDNREIEKLILVVHFSISKLEVPFWNLI